MINYSKLLSESRFYLSQPNNAKPPTSGLWLNKSEGRFEIWDFSQYRKKQRVFSEFKRIAYLDKSAMDNNDIVNNFFDKVMAHMIEAFGPIEAEAWLRTGKSEKIPEDSPTVKARFH